jgi:arginase
VWFDAHADLDTPDDNVSGYFDVISLAMLTGAGWRAQWVSVPGLPVIPGRNVVLAGVRDLEPYQRWRLEASEVRVVAGAIDPDQLAAALDELARRMGRVNLHVDVDALDVAAGRANQYAAPGPEPGGLPERHRGCVRRFTVPAAAITAWIRSTTRTDGSPRPSTRSRATSLGTRPRRTTERTRLRPCRRRAPAGVRPAGAVPRTRL